MAQAGDGYNAQMVAGRHRRRVPAFYGRVSVCPCKKWAIDEAALVAKLRDLTYLEQVALVEAIEQWWRIQCPSGQTDPED